MIIKVKCKALALKGRALGLSRQTFGQLKALYPVSRNKSGHIVWRCKCSCGRFTSVGVGNLRSGHTTSCGCGKSEAIRQARLKYRKGFNEHVIIGSVTLIKLVGHDGSFRAMTRVDTDDLPKLRVSRWSLFTDNYVRSSPNSSSPGVGMHRVIMLKDPIGTSLEVDHKDGNPLNNVKDNLRVCTRAQNVRNSSLRSDNTTGYKGVIAKGSRYVARITFEGERIFIGSYSTLEQAAKAYNAKALELHGDFAKLNNI